MHASSNGDHRRTPVHSEQISLEVALLASESLGGDGAPVALVVASDADVRAYVSDSLKQQTRLGVVSAGSVSSALEVAARSAPRLLVVAHAERAVLRHLPAVPAVLLSDNASSSEVAEMRRLAPLVVLRGAFRMQRLIDTVTSLLTDGVDASGNSHGTR